MKAFGRLPRKKSEQQEPVSEPMMGQVVVEALLIGLKVSQEPEVLADLCQQFDYDFARPPLRVPLTTLRKIRDYLWQRLYPDYTQSQADFEFGRVGMHGYKHTALGRTILSTMHILPLEEVLNNLPHMLSSDVNYGERWIEKHDHNHWEMFFQDDPGEPNTTAGMILGLLEILKVKQPAVRVVLDETLPQAYRVVITYAGK